MTYVAINVFGNLEGDIILPESAFNDSGCVSGCGTSGNNNTASNTGNGANSENNANSNTTNNKATNQNNNANIGNDLNLNANTGDNETSSNTGDDSNVVTGEADVKSNVLNVANNNVEGGNMWLVIINKAGKWFGQLVGGPEGSTMAGSEGMEFEVDGDGNVTASNNGNGAGSENNSNTNETNNETTTQNNNANVQNNLNLSANTGKNNANQNTGGESTVKTGDAKIIANIVNFVNNNVSGTGKMLVAVVNIFGEWTGDFIAPGQQKQNKNNQVAQAQGGAQAVTATPSPTPTATPIAQNQTVTASASNKAKSAVAKVAAVITGSNSILAINSDEEAPAEGSVLGTTMVQNDSQLNKGNVFTINLAYLLLLLPTGFAIYAFKKRAALVKIFNELSKNTRQWFF